MQISFRAKEHIEINDLDISKNLINLMEAIEDHDDVQNVFSNFDITC